MSETQYECKRINLYEMSVHNFFLFQYLTHNQSTYGVTLHEFHELFSMIQTNSQQMAKILTVKAEMIGHFLNGTVTLAYKWHFFLVCQEMERKKNQLTNEKKMVKRSHLKTRCLRKNNHEKKKFIIPHSRLSTRFNVKRVFILSLHPFISRSKALISFSLLCNSRFFFLFVLHSTCGYFVRFHFHS